MESDQTTLGHKLASLRSKKPKFHFGIWLRNTVTTVLNLSLLMAIFALPSWWYFARPNMDRNDMLIILGMLIGLWLIVFGARRKNDTRYSQDLLDLLDLLANDHQRFMRDLRLDAKTAIFDGSNIYHFGNAKELGAAPLAEIARQLRTQGYRIVCFFDANIYFTLEEHGILPSYQTHSMALLRDIFGLRSDEIYVVPSGVQADKYILESLKHLPTSFAVTNDQFRDYAEVYPTVMKDNHWRKGIVISKNEIKLLQHRLPDPILLKSHRRNR